jgi:DNA-binding MarR family transcriptional regulator
MITLKEIVSLQNKSLSSISSKIIYLMVKNQSNQDEWASISLTDFQTSTGIGRATVIAILKRLQGAGLIIKNPHKLSPTHKNQYKTIDL